MTMASAVAPTIANASTFTVTSIADSGAGSLRNAVSGATDGDTINFDPSVAGTINLSSPISIYHNITVQGPGAAQVTLSGQDLVQDLINHAAGAVTISGLTFADGAGATGGAIDNEGDLTLSGVAVKNNTAAGKGGGIYSSGPLSLDKSTVSGNTGAVGGGIYAALAANQNLAVTRSTISGNTATSGEGGGIDVEGAPPADAGCDKPKNSFVAPNAACCECCFAAGVKPNVVCGDAVYRAAATQVATVSTSTISGNTSPSGDAALFLNWVDQTTMVVSSTIASNKSVGLAVGATYGLPIVAASIVAGNTSDCSGTGFNDSGYNVDSDGTCGLSTGTSQSDKTSMPGALSGLADNGGPTRTMALSTASDPAHAVVPATYTAPGGSAAVCASADQRGLVPTSGPCDEGAYQVVPVGPPTITANVSSDGGRSSFGWYNTSVHVTFDCSAATPAFTVDCTPPVDVTTEGHHTIVGTAVQQDGQTASVTRHIKIDETGPVVHAHDKRSYTSANFFTCSDALSGIASCTTHRKTLDDGTMKYKVVAIDKADNKTVRRGTFGDAFTSAG